MKYLFFIGFLTIFSSAFSCSLQSGSAMGDMSKINVESAPKIEAVNGKTPVLVELYTSEGCSSCPPADRILSQLEKEQTVANAEIITLALHVDYWDRLGWKDEFSSPLFSQRQTVYGQQLKLDGVYTPQMIVDGQKQFVGSSLSEANKFIAESAKNEKAKIELNNAENNALKIKIFNVPKHENATVFLAVAEDNLGTNVKGGENSGRKLEHDSVVRQLSSVGMIRAEQNDFESVAMPQFQPDWKRENLKLVVFVQENASRKILGVNKINL